MLVCVNSELPTQQTVIASYSIYNSLTLLYCAIMMLIICHAIMLLLCFH